MLEEMLLSINGIVYSMIIPLLIILVLIRKLINKKRPPLEHSGMAEIVKKEVVRIMLLRGTAPTYEDWYEVTFLIEGNQKVFRVSTMEFDVLDEGDKGLLVYSGTDIISFANKIKAVNKDIFE